MIPFHSLLINPHSVTERQYRSRGTRNGASTVASSWNDDYPRPVYQSQHETRREKSELEAFPTKTPPWFVCCPFERRRCPTAYGEGKWENPNKHWNHNSFAVHVRHSGFETPLAWPCCIWLCLRLPQRYQKCPTQRPGSRHLRLLGKPLDCAVYDFLALQKLERQNARVS